MGTGDEEGTQAPIEQAGEEETATKKTDKESNPSFTASSGVWIIIFACNFLSL